ncbi:hypothetical protein CYMTET_33301, partial [Cymbomonas tetramitiformis]
ALWRFTGGVLKWVLLLWAFLTVGSTLLNPTEDTPVEAMLIATVGIRQIVAAAVGVILYVAVCPTTSPLHAPWIASFLGWRGWRLVSNTAYSLNMLHFRLLMEVAYRVLHPLAEAGLSASNGSWVPVASGEPIKFLLALYVFGGTLSLGVAHLAHRVVEIPCQRILSQRLKKKKSA